MIYYNSNTINDWFFSTDNIIKVYRNNAICYYKIDSSSPSGQTPCYAVVEDISQYSDTEFEDVFNKADGKWYKLNNLNQYEEYGVYGSGRTICSAASFTELTDIIAQSTTALTNHNITVTPAVGAFSKIRIDTTKSATTTSYTWATFTPTPSGSEVLGINMDNIGVMNGYGNNKNYVTDANGSQSFAHWVDDNNTIVEIDIAALSNNQASELYLLMYQENCNPAAFSFYMEAANCVTTYEGKLTIDDGYEYIYSGGSWVNVGEVSGSTATLPNVPFTVNFNAKNYDSQTKTLLKTSGQLADVDAIITAGTPTVGDGYLTIASGTRATISGYQTYFNRTNSAPNLTIISKQNTNGSNCHMFANRDSSYNWMYRPYSTKLTLHGGSETGQLSVTTQPVIESARVDSSRNVKYNNYTNNTTSTTSSFNYGSTNSGKFALFAGYAYTTGEWFVGDFYWVYMSQSTLTDEQVQQVIDYNEGGGGQTEYPIYYDEIQDPPNNVTFTSMTEAESYECPYVGMIATIDGDRYVFSGDSISGYEWVYNPSRLPQGYTEVEYITSENISTSVSGPYIDTNFTPNQNTRVVMDYQPMINGQENRRIFGSGEYNTLGYVYNMEGSVGQSNCYYYYKFGNTSSWYTTTIHPDLNRHTVDFNNNGQILLDNTSIATLPNNTFTCTYHLGLFRSIFNQYTTNSICLLGRVYSCQVYDNGTLVRDFVPCINPSNAVGMYDIVNDVFYTTANASYQFTAGNPV